VLDGAGAVPILAVADDRDWEIAVVAAAAAEGNVKIS
jgi:hypothetical protein